jgi:hypothetical protein
MKVKISMTVEIDEGLWAMEYGLDPNKPSTIRADVMMYCIQQVLDSYAIQHLSVEKDS